MSKVETNGRVTLLLWLHLAAASAAAMFLLLIYSHVRQIIGVSIRYDDAWIATAAKNLALGPGYASSYPDIVLFDPNITTGPPVVLVAAALIRTFGNQYWVPNLAIALCVLVVFGMLGWLVWRRFGALVFSLALALVALRLTFPPYHEAGLLGEIPAAGMVAIGAMLITRSGPRQLFNCMVAGLAVGLAIHTKFITALVLPAFVGILVVARVSRFSEAEGSPQAGSRWGHFGGFGMGVLLPFAAWNLWTLAAVGSWSVWLEIQRSFSDVFFETEALSRFDSLPGGATRLDPVVATFTRNSAALVDHAGGALGVLLFTGAVAVTLIGVFRNRGSARELARDIAPSAVLGGAAVTHGLWWLLFSPNDWLRYLFPGILYMVIAVALAIGVGVRRAPRVFAVAMALLLASWYPQLRAVEWDLGREPRLSALLATRDSLQTVVPDDRALLLACGYWVTWDLEYLLPEAGNFQDCLRLDPRAIGDRRLILVRNEFYNWEQSAQLERFRAACERTVLFAREPFVVSECPGLWPLTFPWAESEPQRLHADHPFAAIHLPGGRPATLVHATSALTLAAAGPASNITVGFGLVDAAWQEGETDGVEFRISIVDARGTHRLWSRLVDPRSHPDDRGHLTATVPVPGTFRGGQVLAETLPGPNSDPRWDWAYWSKIDVR